VSKRLSIHNPENWQAILGSKDVHKRLEVFIRRRLYKSDLSTLNLPIKNSEFFEELFASSACPVKEDQAKGFKDFFTTHFEVQTLKLLKRFDSAKAETSRLLFEATDGSKFETVILRHPKNPYSGVTAEGPGRSTLCISSQTACALRCTFCATGHLAPGRNLEVSEIIEQVWLSQVLLHKEGRQVRNLVFMGMGEPLLNYDNLRKALEILLAHPYFSLGRKRITVSTAGIIPKIYKLAEAFPGLGLAISLHAPTSSLRENLMPVEKLYPLKDLMEAAEFYAKDGKTEIFYEYLLIDEVNDQPENARDLAELLRGKAAHVNLIPWNPLQEEESPSKEKTAFREQRLSYFHHYLKNQGIPCTIRYSMGSDIDAACGQLAAQEALK